MNVVIETRRLLLRTFTIDDAQLIYELNNDENVTRFTHDPLNSIDEARDVLEKIILPQYTLYNLGRWAIHLKANLEFIGWSGLKYHFGLNEIDLGYRIKQSAWGKGYATEAAFACLKHGFEQLHIKKITGRAEKGNIASCHVLEKIGMQFIREEMTEGQWIKTYELTSPPII